MKPSDNREAKGQVLGSERLTKMYADGKWLVGYKYLPRERRTKIIEGFRPIVLKHGLDFASCREGFPGLNTMPCDCTAYCRTMLDSYLK